MSFHVTEVLKIPRHSFLELLVHTSPPAWTHSYTCHSQGSGAVQGALWS